MKMNADMTKEERQVIIDSFKAELKNLLEKYDAAISWTCGSGSDMHGIYDEQMEVCFSVAKGKEAYGYEFETHLAYGSSVSVYDLNLLLDN